MNFSDGILVVSSNKGKIKEIRSILSKVDSLIFFTVGVKYPDFYVEESGKTFCDNALIKAKAYAEKYGIISLADDSGLEVDALGGRPGVESARYAGAEATDAQRVQKLLDELKNVPLEKRTARFKCCICVYNPKTKKTTFGEGTCEGKITDSPRGTNGFGYDPVFEVEGFDGKTMAEITLEEKSTVSHRARALLVLSKKIS